MKYFCDECSGPMPESYRPDIINNTFDSDDKLPPCICSEKCYIKHIESIKNNHGTEEGSKCNREGCNGIIELPLVEECYCHISPPCNACIENKLQCTECGWENEEEGSP